MKKLVITPRSQIRNAIRQLWLRSRERQAALKRDKYTCQEKGCGLKQSRAKGKEVYVEVDHLDGIEWELLIDLVYHYVLVDPKHLQTACKKHHAERTARRKPTAKPPSRSA